MFIRFVWDEMFHAEGRTDGKTDRHGEANSPFSYFAKAPSNDIVSADSSQGKMECWLEVTNEISKINYVQYNTYD